MQRFLTSCALTGALGLACGSPAGLDAGTFPTLDQTGYAASGGTTQGAGQGGSGAVPGTGGSAGAPANSNGGGPPASAGSGATGGSGTTGMMTANGCPSDVTTLFARPKEQGGCTSGGGSHEATSPIKPDLVSPNVAARLLNIASSCTKTSSGMAVPARPYIGKDDSFLEEKIAGSPNQQCGVSMPFFMPDALSAADEQCIIAWIDQVAGG